MALQEPDDVAELTDEEFALLSPAIQALARDFQLSGWTAQCRRPKYGIRHWCGGPSCRHQAWLPLVEETPGTIDRIRDQLDSLQCFAKKETA